MARSPAPDPMAMSDDELRRSSAPRFGAQVDRARLWARALGPLEVSDPLAIARVIAFAARREAQPIVERQALRVGRHEVDLAAQRPAGRHGSEVVVQPA